MQITKALYLYQSNKKLIKKLQPCIVRPLCSGILWVHNAIIQIMLVIMENACYVQFRKVFFFFLFYCVANIAFQVQKSPLTLCFKWTKLTVNPALWALSTARARHCGVRRSFCFALTFSDLTETYRRRTYPLDVVAEMRAQVERFSSDPHLHISIIW